MLIIPNPFFGLHFVKFHAYADLLILMNIFDPIKNDRGQKTDLADIVIRLDSASDCTQYFFDSLELAEIDLHKIRVLSHGA